MPKGDAARRGARRSRCASRSPALLAHDPGRGWAAIRRICISFASRRGGCARSCARRGPCSHRARPRISARELGWLGGALGPARDLDVLLEHFSERGRARSTARLRRDRPGCSPRSRSAERGDRATSARGAVLADRYFALLDRLDALRRRPPRHGESETLAAIFDARRSGCAAPSRRSATTRRTTRCTRSASASSARATPPSSPAHELGKRGAQYVARAKAAAGRPRRPPGRVRRGGARSAPGRAARPELAARGRPARRARARPARRGARRLAGGLGAPRASGAEGASADATSSARPAGSSSGRGDAGLEVLVVHRPRYDDWTFPKGKAERGETDEECALREVEEETGLVCTLGRELAVDGLQGRGGPAEARALLAHAPVGGRADVRPRGRRRPLAPVAEARGAP